MHQQISLSVDKTEHVLGILSSSYLGPWVRHSLCTLGLKQTRPCLGEFVGWKKPGVNSPTKIGHQWLGWDGQLVSWVMTFMSLIW